MYAWGYLLFAMLGILLGMVIASLWQRKGPDTEGRVFEEFAMAAQVKEDFVHPSQSFSSRWPEDQKLRKRGFVIDSRRGAKEPTWTRNGVPYSHSEALAFVESEEKKDKK